MRPITFAHRGARLEAPDSSIEAFSLALAAGVAGLETDARLSSDGQVVLSHDAALRRGWRRIRVRSTPAAELAEAGVPSLNDLYSRLGTDFELSVDVKVEGAGAQTAAVARAHGAQARLWLCSPDLDVVTSLRSHTDVRVVHSTRMESLDLPVERHAAHLAELGVDAMNMHHTEWTGGLVSLFHRFGIRAFAWDCQEVRHLRAMLRIDIDALYCDRPSRMTATVGEWVAETNRPG